jgi:Ca2+:H+ antiporter
LAGDVLWVSRITSVLLIIAYAIYIYFNMRSHHGIYDDIFEEDERRDEDRHVDLVKDKLTLIECIIALTISIGLVSFLATLLVEEIPTIVHEHHISEAFMGLILVPMVEKFAEHLTAIDEAWDNTMNLALSHVLGSTIQTALFNAPLVVIVSWGLGKEMDLNFEIFTIVVVILSIIVMGNFLRDQKSNYLEGALSVIIWIIIAVAAYYTPEVVTDSAEVAPAESGTASGTASAVAAATETAVAAVHRMLMK